MGDFKETLQRYRTKVERELAMFMHTLANNRDPHLKKQYSRTENYVLNPAKRLRPVGLIMAYKGFKGQNKDIYKTSLAVELFHNSTLIHDDVMDEDEERRGKSTLYKTIEDRFGELSVDKKYGGSIFSRDSTRYAVTQAFCLGNTLSIMGNDIILNSSFPLESKIEAAKIYNQSYKTVNEGQLKDSCFEFQIPSEQQYFDMISKKTANLFKASLEIGAVLAKAHSGRVKFLTDYALSAALAFQLKDDLMDIDADSKKGHELGSDIKNGKNTLLVIKALELGKMRGEKLFTALGNENADSSQIESAINAIYGSGAVQYVEDIATKHIEISKQALERAELTKQSYDFFKGFADYMLDRKR